MKTAEIACMTAFARNILEHASSFDWSVQGFGMARTYVGENKRYRLNVWHSALRVPGVSVIHDHPWDFRSWVLAGRFYNRRYRLGYGIPHKYLVIEPGANFDGTAFEAGEALLEAQPLECYFPGDTYEQRADEIHASYYDDGTVTINDRTNRGPDRARVFWEGGEWVDAKPRSATGGEVDLIQHAALGEFRQ